ncbi:BlaI/MecI/CopY family transcriptional regulator [Sulfodiicoccus acidiphilus]|uniref:BlaI/MecI/CopY family transcriptional regulator n=1 Tax=Sulfodiicoccus acidiphilus TaxID=1670455 RepID=UPI00131549A0|nr:BlaI/MecI/CopY family transcriptional regulator [Sulfodiicoccus acidiphilus]
MDELGELERLVMEVVWSRGRAFVKDVHEELSRTRSLAPTTVSTVLDRLYRKGFLRRELVKEGGLRYIYYPKVTREEFQRSKIRRMATTILDSLEDPAFASILGDTNLKELKERLRRLASSESDRG